MIQLAAGLFYHFNLVVAGLEFSGLKVIITIERRIADYEAAGIKNHVEKNVLTAGRHKDTLPQCGGREIVSASSVSGSGKSTPLGCATTATGDHGQQGK